MNASARNENDILLLMVIFSFSVLSICSCSIRVDQSDIYGTYNADYNVAKETLILKEDGTFIQEVTLKSTSKVDIAKGKWHYHPEDGHIIFDENFLDVLNGFHQLIPDYPNPKVKGYAWIPVGKYYLFFGRTQIGSGEGIPYYKQ